MKAEDKQIVRDKNLKFRKDRDAEKDKIGFQAMIEFKRAEKKRKDEELASILKSKILE